MISWVTQNKEKASRKGGGTTMTNGHIVAEKPFQIFRLLCSVILKA
jgi:hypothetical protein